MKFIIFALLLISSSVGLAKDVIDLDWQHLMPESPRNSVVLPDLTKDQLAQIQRIYSLTYSETDEAAEEILEIKLALKKEGIDTDEVFRLREEFIKNQQMASEALTTQYDGQHVRIPGFLVPLKLEDGMMTTDFLLVPVAGACIHVPPPPANQIVRVTYPEGYEMKSIRDPIWVEGKLSSKLQTDELYIVDGTSNITMGYSLDATSVVDYN